MRRKLTVAYAILLVSSSSLLAAQAPTAMQRAGCYALGDSTGKSLTGSFPGHIQLDTTPVKMDPAYRTGSTITYGVRSQEPLDSTSQRSRPALARTVAFWFIVGNDSIVLHTQSKFTKHQFRFHVRGDSLSGVQKYENDVIDPSNPFRWVGATGRRVRCSK